jgi:hypothetical protein
MSVHSIGQREVVSNQVFLNDVSMVRRASLIKQLGMVCIKLRALVHLL